jgi:hypothetical protein
MTSLTITTALTKILALTVTAAVVAGKTRDNKVPCLRPKKETLKEAWRAMKVASTAILKRLHCQQY